jgi:hypothetical protein
VAENQPLNAGLDAPAAINTASAAILRTTSTFRTRLPGLTPR